MIWTEALSRCLATVKRRGLPFARVDSLAGLTSGYTRKLASNEVPAKAYQAMFALVESGVDPHSLFMPAVMWREDDTRLSTPLTPLLSRPSIEEVVDWMSNLRGSPPETDDPMLEYCNLFKVPGDGVEIEVVGVGRLSVTAINAGVFSPRQMERMISNSPDGQVYTDLANDMKSLVVGQVVVSEPKHQTLYLPPDIFHNGVTRTVRLRCDNDWIVNFAQTVTLSIRRDSEDSFAGNEVPAVMATRDLEHL